VKILIYMTAYIVDADARLRSFVDIPFASEIALKEY